MAIGDWGSAGVSKQHFGGTSMYASSQAFQQSNMKDLFAFGRIAMELYLNDSGNETFIIFTLYYLFQSGWH